MYALFHVFILHKFEDNVGFRRVRVEAGVSGLIVAFIEDYRVLSFGYFRLASDLARPSVHVEAPLAVRFFARALVWTEIKRSAFALLVFLPVGPGG